MVDTYGLLTHQTFNLYTYIYECVLVHEMLKSTRYHNDRADNVVFTSKRLPQQPVS